MEDKAAQISERLLNYVVAIIKICARLSKMTIGKHIGNQLLRSGTSVGAN
jgi:four helix bundle protein